MNEGDEPRILGFCPCSNWKMSFHVLKWGNTRGGGGLGEEVSTRVEVGAFTSETLTALLKGDTGQAGECMSVWSRGGTKAGDVVMGQ